MLIGESIVPINTANLSEGSYTVEVIGNNSVLLTTKMVKLNK